MLPDPVLPPQSPEVVAALADPNFLTDFLDWCDIVVTQIKASPHFTPTVEMQLGLLTPPAPPSPATMQPTINSFHDGPQGLVEFNINRQNQPQIEVEVTLDDGSVLKNRLPSAKIPLNLPHDRPHAFSAVARYTDKMGVPYGLDSQPFKGTSEV